VLRRFFLRLDLTTDGSRALRSLRRLDSHYTAFVERNSALILTSRLFIVPHIICTAYYRSDILFDIFNVVF